MWDHFPSAVLLNTIAFGLISSLMGNSCFFFLSSLHVISLTFPSEAYDKSNWPSSHSSKKEFSTSKTGFLHSSYNHGHTKKAHVLGWLFFFFKGGRVARDTE